MRSIATTPAPPKTIRSVWVREHADELRTRGKSHRAAPRQLGTRWLVIGWTGLNHSVLDDETLHQANRSRAREQLAA